MALYVMGVYVPHFYFDNYLFTFFLHQGAVVTRCFRKLLCTFDL